MRPNGLAPPGLAVSPNPRERLQVGSHLSPDVSHASSLALGVPFLSGCRLFPGHAFACSFYSGRTFLRGKLRKPGICPTGEETISSFKNVCLHKDFFWQ